MENLLTKKENDDKINTNLNHDFLNKKRAPTDEI